MTPANSNAPMDILPPVNEKTGDEPATVGLLIGGWSAEREVSLTKGKAVEAGLIEAGYRVRVIDVKKDLPALIAALTTPEPVDVVFNNLYGRGGEDGVIQGVLEVLGLPYTHSGVLASALCMNKPMTRNIAQASGIPVARGEVLRVADIEAGRISLEPPYVIKPACEGSSVGVYMIRKGDNRIVLSEEDRARDDLWLAEDYIPGRELTIAVLDGQPQAVTEILPGTEFFDYESKYADVGTRYVLPAEIPADVTATVLEYAARIYHACGCAGLARCDFRYDDSKPGASGLAFLEVNTQPGLTAESIGPSQLVYNGVTFPALCAHLVEQARWQNDKPAAADQPAERKSAQK